MNYDDNSMLLNNFKLLGDITRQPVETRIEDTYLDKLNMLISEKIPETFKKHAPPNYYELYDEFTALYEQLRGFILNKGLIGKNVVALGGGFSSGKSSFLNALDDEPALPTNINPSTAVPTFIVNGQKHECHGINTFRAYVPIDLKSIRLISSGFGEITDENGIIITKSLTLGHLLKSILLQSPKQIYENLAFADTPGFSNSDSHILAKEATDEHISRSQLNSSSYIILFVQADAGTLKEKDIEFINSLREDIPKLFIISKADYKNENELERIKGHIKSILTRSGIQYVDVLTFSNQYPTQYDTKKIREILNSWNKTANPPQFARNFKKLFIACRDYFEKEIEDERRRLERLNTSLTKLSGEDSSTIEPLRQMVTEIQSRVSKLKETQEKLKELHREFFTELKRLGDLVGIAMPEPSEVDMKEDVPDALSILKAYKKSKGIKTGANTAKHIEDAFSNIRSNADYLSGITELRNTLSIIKRNLGVPK